MLSVNRQQFAMDWPLRTHWRQATCEEVGCRRYVMGFTTQLDTSVQAHSDAADWLRYKSGMKYTESKDVEGLTTFAFPAGQDCWEGQAGRHRVKTGRPEELSQRTVSGVRRFERGIDWNESMNEEMYAVERRLERG